MALLEVSDLEASYGAVKALHRISFHVEPGEIVAFVGSNGAGKSTTLRSISGILAKTVGSIKFDGKELRGMAAHKVAAQGIAHVPEGRRVFSRLSVHENLLTGAYLVKSKTEIAQRIEGVLETFPRLKERFKQPSGTLSGGEQQMLAMARGLMSNPRMLLLDEPSMGLAPILVQQIFEQVQQLNESGMTILLVEQNANQALQIANRAYVLQNGNIQMSGDAKVLLNDEAIREAYLA